MSTRTYHDPLHHGISLDTDQPAEAMVLSLVDSAPFQRLRRIRQLGPAFLTFHGAESSRFTHSLGVFAIARRAMGRLIELDPSLKSEQGVLYAAALLHDLGHAPLSHTGEEMFGTHHEQWSARIVRDHPQIRTPLESFAAGTADAVADLLEHGRSKRGVIKALVSSQLDCDRLDYLLRDSYSTGARYGQLDLERILAAITLAPDGEMAIHPKGLMAVEHYLVVRNLMYRSVYNHRLNVVCNWLLEQLIRQARRLGPDRIWADATMRDWLWESSELDLDRYLANDDIRTGYHLQRWRDEAPEPLAELCDRFINRRLLKALDVSQLSASLQLELLAKAQTSADRAGLDPELCCGLRHHQIYGYHPYRGGLRLWDGHNLQALEQCSPLVNSLATPADTAWLIHPREITDELREAHANTL
ncbi:HD domain-containing protein [Synechococcus sp. NOUM97013]|uniref:HD domain-containing protein n=1 Tax=Synechococcus sp. NOUM97013 TaxID=1442555 RepID=UPI0016471C2E|nr:HD domain-containing protein [Synechococcus sp. NOUM97013]QNI72650.1 HD domain-containing protein [Synechococcus sp. NOUM97013]